MPEIVPNTEISTRRKSLPLTGSPSRVGDRQVNDDSCDCVVWSAVLWARLGGLRVHREGALFSVLMQSGKNETGSLRYPDPGGGERERTPQGENSSVGRPSNQTELRGQQWFSKQRADQQHQHLPGT